LRELGILAITQKISLTLSLKVERVMSQFNRILLPVNGSKEAIRYALDMARRSDAKLYFLLTYRLLDEINKQKSKDKSIKLTLDEQIEEEFFETNHDLLQDCDVEYELLVEVGFLSDRIISNIQEREIDMLLLDGLSKVSDEKLIERFAELHVPVLLIPNQETAYIKS
jgi:hypothetical protein